MTAAGSTDRVLAAIDNVITDWDGSDGMRCGPATTEGQRAIRDHEAEEPLQLTPDSEWTPPTWYDLDRLYTDEGALDRLYTDEGALPPVYDNGDDDQGAPALTAAEWPGTITIGADGDPDPTGEHDADGQHSRCVGRGRTCGWEHTVAYRDRLGGWRVTYDSPLTEEVPRAMLPELERWAMLGRKSGIRFFWPHGQKAPDAEAAPLTRGRRKWLRIKARVAGWVADAANWVSTLFDRISSRFDRAALRTYRDLDAGASRGPLDDLLDQHAVRTGNAGLPPAGADVPGSWLPPELRRVYLAIEQYGPISTAGLATRLDLDHSEVGSRVVALRRLGRRAPLAVTVSLDGELWWRVARTSTPAGS